MLNVKRTIPYNINEVFEARSYESMGYTMNYRLYVPKNYDCGEMYPLVVFLHGSDERGDDNCAQLKNGLQVMFDDVTSPIYDSIVLVPQCPKCSWWTLASIGERGYSIADTPESRELEALCEIIDELAGYYNVDEDRVYVTGISMGGFGTWDLLSRHGARFAAGMPICGGGDPSYAKLLSRIPIRTFHGSADECVPVTLSRVMYASIRREGGKEISYTEYDGGGHVIWDTVYGDRENIDWLFAQSRRERRLKAERAGKIKKAAIFGGIGAVVSAVLVIAGVKKLGKKKK